MTTIEYCLDNVDRETRARLAHAAVDDHAKPCLQRCGDCHEGAILVVDGNLECDADHARLLERVVETGGGEWR